MTSSPRLNAQLASHYWNVIQFGAHMIEARSALERRRDAMLKNVARFEAAHDAWRKAAGLPQFERKEPSASTTIKD